MPAMITPRGDYLLLIPWRPAEMVGSLMLPESAQSGEGPGQEWDVDLMRRCGVVAEVGPAVIGYKPGDEVFCDQCGFMVLVDGSRTNKKEARLLVREVHIAAVLTRDLPEPRLTLAGGLAERAGE